MAWYELTRAMTKEKPAGVYALCGPETFLKREALAAMKRSLLGDSASKDERYAVDSFRLGENDSGAILSAASQTGLFGGERLVWVEGLERYPRLAQKEREEWFRVIAERPANPVLLVSEMSSRELSRRAKALAELLSAVTVVDFWYLYPDRAAEWVMKRGQKHGLEISSEVAARLVRHVGADLLALSKEIEKIALLHGPGPLDEEELRTLARRGVLGSSWDCVEHILAGDLHASLEGLLAVQREESAFGFAWKLNQAVARSLGGEGGGHGESRGGPPRGAPHSSPPAKRNDASLDKKLLGRLLWGCYEWERDIKTGRWAGANDYPALEALVIAHMERLRRSGRVR
ncbi:MAG: hypothetical protein KA123_00410 [Candidatus Eisenbacteria bacterium]|nr:hypothetical protein [Candidatus Eisenbacteria bacterium]